MEEIKRAGKGNIGYRRRPKKVLDTMRGVEDGVIRKNCESLKREKVSVAVTKREGELNVRQ